MHDCSTECSTENFRLTGTNTALSQYLSNANAQGLVWRRERSEAYVALWVRGHQGERASADVVWALLVA